MTREGGPITKLLGDAKPRLPHLLAQARNDNTQRPPHSHTSLRKTRTPPNRHCEEPAFWATWQSLVLKGYSSPPNFHCEECQRHDAAISVPKSVLGPQKRDCHACLRRLAMTVPKDHTAPTTSLRGGALFAPTWQSPVLKGYSSPPSVIARRDGFCPDEAISGTKSVLGPQKRDCFGSQNEPRNDDPKRAAFPPTVIARSPHFGRRGNLRY